MRNGGGATGTRFSAIRFLQLLEGKGDFGGESFRIRASINVVTRKRASARDCR